MNILKVIILSRISRATNRSEVTQTTHYQSEK
jgi:hypothetical protein